MENTDVNQDTENLQVAERVRRGEEICKELSIIQMRIKGLTDLLDGYQEREAGLIEEYNDL